MAKRVSFLMEDCDYEFIEAMSRDCGMPKTRIIQIVFGMLAQGFRRGWGVNEADMAYVKSCLLDEIVRFREEKGLPPLT